MERGFLSSPHLLASLQAPTPAPAMPFPPLPRQPRLPGAYSCQQTTPQRPHPNTQEGGTAAQRQGPQMQGQPESQPWGRGRQGRKASLSSTTVRNPAPPRASGQGLPAGSTVAITAINNVNQFIPTSRSDGCGTAGILCTRGAEFTLQSRTASPM